VIVFPATAATVPSSGGDPMRTVSPALMPVASTVVGLHLQHGRYRVRLDRGAAIYESPVVEVGPKPVTTTVDVDPI